MTNKKKTLIEALYGSFMFMDNLPDLIDQEDIYDEQGYVDIEFMTAILEWMTRSIDITLKIQKSLNLLLGIEEVKKKGKKNETGSNWSVQEILRNCTLENDVMKLPNVTLNKKSYAEAKKWIEEAGGRWQGGKLQGFVFPFNPERVFRLLNEGKRCNLQQEFQFFETPSELCDKVVSMAECSSSDRILEPSAGRGAIIKAIHRVLPGIVVDYYELMPENREMISSMKGICYKGEDFTKVDPSPIYDRIIANPPFSNNQDVKHVRIMYDWLSTGGRIVAITSTHWCTGSEKICEDFRAWLKDHNAQITDIEAGAFRESNTEVSTKIIVIDR